MLAQSSPADQDPAEYLSKEQVSKLFGISERTVHRFIQSGDLEAVRIGPRLVRITAESVARLARPVDDGAA
jgi:excisionase family DNA binding protein